MNKQHVATDLISKNRKTAKKQDSKTLEEAIKKQYSSLSFDTKFKFYSKESPMGDDEE